MVLLLLAILCTTQNLITNPQIIWMTVIRFLRYKIDIYLTYVWKTKTDVVFITWPTSYEFWYLFAHYAGSVSAIKFVYNFPNSHYLVIMSGMKTDMLSALQSYCIVL